MHIVTVSIIIAVYNEELGLRNFLDSIINQTYPHLEIILLDDGSTDNSGKICDEYVQKDNRFVVVHLSHKGIAFARNIGLTIAKGDYIMFADADDSLEPSFCEKPLKNALEKNVDVVSFGYTKTYFNGNTRVLKTNNPRVISSSEAIRILITLEDIIHGFVWNKIYKRSLFDTVRFSLKRTFSDQSVNYLLFDRAKKIYISDEVLYHYKRRQGSLSSSHYLPDSIQNRFQMWHDRLLFIQQYYPENETYQIHQLVEEANYVFFFLSSKRQYKQFVHEVEEFFVENKEKILQVEKKKKVKLLLFYYCRPFFRLYYSFQSKRYWNKKESRK